MFEELRDSEEKYINECKTVHIICGESAAGSLKVGLNRRTDKVIGFPDFFAVGPIYHLHKEIGLNKRYEWLDSRLNEKRFIPYLMMFLLCYGLQKMQTNKVVNVFSHT